jgi:hypothetical protein
MGEAPAESWATVWKQGNRANGTEQINQERRRRKMKKITAIVLAIVLMATLIPGVALADKSPIGYDDLGNPIWGGNGCPSGPHYNLNIIGVQWDKNEDFDGGNGHRIFVDLDGKCNIQLACGDFEVLDANGTDGTAEFQLPNPDPENTGTSEYSVFARALGTPNGKADMTTGAYEWIDGNANGVVDPGELYLRMSVITLKLERGHGKQTFTNVTKYLLYIYVDLDGNGKAERYNIFSDALQDYFWEYDNKGLKLCQLRFYPGVQTTVPDEIPLD